MNTGKIVSLADREFGFIKRVGLKDNLFFHADGLIGVTFAELKEGDTLTFTVTESLKGPYATQIQRTN